MAVILPGIERVKASLMAAVLALIGPGGGSGSQFDPALVETFLTVADESRRVPRKDTDSLRRRLTGPPPSFRAISPTS
jgi:hypothetical protein